MIDYKINILRRGGVFKQIYWEADSPPSIRFDSDALIKSSLIGTFVYDPEIDISKDELQPVLIKDGKESPFGVFRISTSQRSGDQKNRDYTGNLMKIEAYDRCYILRETKTETILHMAAGARYLDEITKLLADAGIARYQADQTDSVLPTAREDWEVGTPYIQIINELLSEIGFDPIFFDAYGAAVLRRYRPPAASEISHNYSASDVQRVPMAPGWRQETDIFSAANVFIFICSNADNPEPMIATAVNDSPLSAKSIINRGLRIPKVEKVNQIADQAALQLAANKARDASLLGAYTISIEVEPEGGHAMGQTVSVDHPDIGGIYREKGWQISLKPGELLKLDLQKEVLR